MNKSTLSLLVPDTKLEYRPDLAPEFKHFLRVHARLSSFNVDDFTKTLAIHAQNEISITGNASNVGVEIDISYSVPDSTQAVCLVVQYAGIGRTAVFVVPSDLIVPLDQRLHDSKHGGIDFIEVYCRALVLTKEDNRAGYSHCSQTIWLPAMTHFFWTDIPTEPTPEPGNV